jgi:cytochrome c-type biogenesis protein CcmH
MPTVEFIAGVATGVIVTLLAIVWRAARPFRRRHLLIAALGVGFAAAAGVIYLAIGAHANRMAPTAAATASGTDAATSPPARSMELEVSALEARLARTGGSDADWTLLAQSYDFLGRPEDARRARAHIAASGATPVSQMSAATLTAAAAASATAVSPAPPTVASHAEPGDGSNSQLAELERRVGAHPDDANTWLTLAELRRQRHDYAGAGAAYRRLVELRAMSAQSWADYADVLGSLAGGSLTGEAGHAIDKALALDATNSKALWLKASQAHEQRHYAQALAWWQKLRALLPADSEDAKAVDANIAEASELAGQATATAATGTGASASAAAGVEVSGTVSLDKRFSDRVQSDATLFIYAKAADSPGPPLAVLRTTVGSWPVSFRLDDSMAMIPSRRLSQFERVVIEARISRSGQATPAAGDLYVTSPVLHPLPGTRLVLVIDREIG